MKEININEVKKEQGRLQELLKTAGTGMTVNKKGEICLVVFIWTDEPFDCPLQIKQYGLARLQREDGG